MPQRSSWLAVQTLINQRLTNLAILAEVRRQTPQISLRRFGAFFLTLILCRYGFGKFSLG